MDHCIEDERSRNAIASYFMEELVTQGSTLNPLPLCTLYDCKRVTASANYHFAEGAGIALFACVTTCPIPTVCRQTSPHCFVCVWT